MTGIISAAVRKISWTYAIFLSFVEKISTMKTTILLSIPAGKLETYSYSFTSFRIVYQTLEVSFCISNVVLPRIVYQTLEVTRVIICENSSPSSMKTGIHQLSRKNLPDPMISTKLKNLLGQTIALISKIVVSSIAIVATSILSQIPIQMLTRPVFGRYWDGLPSGRGTYQFRIEQNYFFLRFFA